ncbi:MAG: hypothetical protein E7389_02450 [Ruminococcaceae bacterium]|nr:hypothetical protein [Oscillospiraceae bacterium]
MKKQNLNERTEREELLYHNTEILLKRYRDVVWSIEVSAIQAQLNFELEMDCKLEEFLEMSYAAGADLSETKIQEQMRTLERNKKMLKIIETAVNVLRKKQLEGEVYYWIIYYTYLSEKPIKSVEDIIAKVADKTDYMSWKTYFTKRRKAIETLSTILWGFTSKECLPILNKLDIIHLKNTSKTQKL